MTCQLITGKTDGVANDVIDTRPCSRSTASHASRQLGMLPA
jgi:hypothetical protein